MICYAIVNDEGMFLISEDDNEYDTLPYARLWVNKADAERVVEDAISFTEYIETVVPVEIKLAQENKGEESNDS